MKIVAKRCPSCGADLDFAYGDHDVECKACRHKYAIEYEDGEIEIQSVEDRGFGVSMNEALEAMEQFSRAFRRSYPHIPSKPGRYARHLAIDKWAFEQGFRCRGLTPEALKKRFPTMTISYDVETNEYIFTEEYYVREPAIPPLCETQGGFEEAGNENI